MDSFPWGQALQASNAASAEVVGWYENLGSASWSSGASVQLYPWLFEGPLPYQMPGDRHVIIHLTRVDPSQLRVEARWDGKLQASRLVPFRWEPDDASHRGASLRVERPAKGGTSNLGVGWETKSLRLRKGTDGCLYAETRVSGGGLFGYFFPFYATSTHWMRWEPATP